VKSEAFDTGSRRTIGRIFTVPALLGVFSAGGLVFALVEDGVWDAVCCMALAIPIILLVVCIARGRA
jgi:hypothetical protein